MVDETGLRSTSADRELERVDDEVGAQLVLQRPADDATRVAVDHDGQVEPALPGAEVADVCDPEPVRRGGPEVAPDEVVGDADAGDADGAAAAAVVP